MKAVIININGKDVEIQLTKEQLKQINAVDPMQKVYEYHNTTEEDFDKLYKDIPKHVKAYEKECMVVAYYNKGWVPDWTNSSEYKYHLYFRMNEFRLYSCYCICSYSYVPTRLCFKNKKDALDAIENFYDVFKESRTL